MSGSEVTLSIAFESVSPDSLFYSLFGEWNALSLELEDGETRDVGGRGAGRWPTTEAVIADVFEIARCRCYSVSPRERMRISQSALG